MKADKEEEKPRETLNKAIIHDQYVRIIIPSDFGASFVISGLLAATFKTMTAPFERIKLILQTQMSSEQMSKMNTTRYLGFFDALVRIPREQGFWSLWRGNFINICRYFPAQAINFALYDVYYRALVQVMHPKTAGNHDALLFLAGGSVGMTSCTILYPLTYCNTRISVDVADGKHVKREFYTLNDCLRKVYKSEGLKGFYQGLPCSAVGMFLYRSTYFGIYTAGKKIYFNDYSFDPTSHVTSAPFLVSLVLAQLASTVSTFVAYPLDTISRQKMLWCGYVSTRQVVTNILRKEGLVGFYRGVFANLLTTVSGTLVLVSFDIVKGYYERFMQREGE